MKITAIKQQTKNPDRVSIFVDNVYSFSLTLDELLREKLVRGLELDKPRLKVLKQLSAEGKLKMRVLNWLLLRPHSTREYKDYMYRKKADPDLVAAWAAEFSAKDYLNDVRFADWLVEQRVASGKSNRALRAELRQKGIDSETINSVLETTRDNEETRLRELISKKRRLSRYQDNTKLLQYLVRLGFSYSSAKAALGADEAE
jgi:regulatory protein